MIRATLLIACLSSAAAAQPFEVASIRVHAENPHYINIRTSGPRLTADAETLRGLVMWAYHLKNYQISGPANSPVGDTFYDIVAKAEGDDAPTPEAFRQMLQSLLADRFQLKVHREMRSTPVYALVIGKNGPKLEAADPDAPPIMSVRAVDRKHEWSAPHATLDDIADGLSNSLDRPVVDQTSLTGTYSVKMTYTPDLRSFRESPDPNDISIFTAVQSLGLKLEPKNVMMEILVVDHVAKASEN